MLVRRFLAPVVVVVLTAACAASEVAPRAESPSPVATLSPTPSAPPSPWVAPTPTPTPTPSPSPTSLTGSPEIDHALAKIAARVDAPILYPSALPSTAHLAEDHPVRFSTDSDGVVTGTLSLVVGDDELEIEYGATNLAGCDEDFDHFRETHVGSEPALLASASDRAAIIWPATRERPQGTYKLHGSFTGPEILRLARSMQSVPGLEPQQPPPAC